MPDPPTHSGVLKKLGGSVMQRYQQRWFAIHDLELKYWKTEKEAKKNKSEPLGTIRACDIATVTEGKDHRFVLKGKQLRHDYELSASDEKDKKTWVEHIRKTMQRTRERRTAEKQTLSIDQNSILIRACTLNVAEGKPTDHCPDEISSWLTGKNSYRSPEWSDRDISTPSIISVCLQEVDMTAKGIVTDAINTLNPREAQWTDFFTTLLPGYELVASGHEASVLVALFVEKNLKISSIETVYWRGKVLKGLIEAGNKGAISIRFRLDSDKTTFCFTGCHLPPHPEGFSKRNQAYHSILEDSQFSEGPSLITDHDYAIWFGDLNYRMKGSSFSKGEAEKELLSTIRDNIPKAVKKYDQLSEARTKNGDAGAFQVFHEAEIQFFPTYKLHVERNLSATLESQYRVKTEGHHLPSFCDRVLYFSKGFKPTPVLRLWSPLPLAARRLPTEPDRARPLGTFPARPPEVPAEMASIGIVCLDYTDTPFHSDHRGVAALFQII
eukprot:TRINITY_DN12286_c0_g1_i1.p1 TRINITY_DN12286_c0_g1~~TRINITY_DN12286_c0_g1_i1.p1  ORF type:complete len:496 (+),score=44.60 TRINITY_DN12286_c0_g1_i1:64-1551(+)